MGFELVVARIHAGPRPRLQIMAEPIDRQRAMTVEDCAEISHAVSAVLDVADPIHSAYTLEVSSPGIDRPLVRPEHFLRFKGERARLETLLPVTGRRRFIGRLEGIEDGSILLSLVEPEGGPPLRVPLDGLKRASLVADAPLRAATRPGGRGGKQGRVGPKRGTKRYGA